MPNPIVRHRLASLAPFHSQTFSRSSKYRTRTRYLRSIPCLLASCESRLFCVFLCTMNFSDSSTGRRLSYIYFGFRFCKNNTAGTRMRSPFIITTRLFCIVFVHRQIVLHRLRSASAAHWSQISPAGILKLSSVAAQTAERWRPDIKQTTYALVLLLPNLHEQARSTHLANS